MAGAPAAQQFSWLGTHSLLSPTFGTVTFILWVSLPSFRRLRVLSPSSAAVLSGLPFAVAVVSVLVWSRSSDRSNKRVLHTYLPLFLSSLVFPFTAIPNQPLFLLLRRTCACPALMILRIWSFLFCPAYSEVSRSCGRCSDRPHQFNRGPGRIRWSHRLARFPTEQGSALFACCPLHVLFFPHSWASDLCFSASTGLNTTACPPELSRSV